MYKMMGMRRIVLTICVAITSAVTLHAADSGEDLHGTEVSALEGRTRQDGRVNKDEADIFVADEIEKEGTPPYRVVRLRKSFTPPPGFTFDPFKEKEKDRPRIMEALRMRIDPEDGQSWFFWTHEPAYVDIWFDPEDALVFGDIPTMFESKTETEGPSLIKVSALLADSQKAAHFPLRCDGNLIPPPGGEPAEFHWSAIVAGAIDLDVDTDNTGEVYDGPDRDLIKEDRWEAAESDQDPGKYVPVNDNDTDNDQIPGFADGFSKFGSKSNTSTGTKFVKAILDVSNVEEVIDWDKARVRFTYSSSDPDATMEAGTSEKKYYKPASGKLRIWTKDASTQRDPKPVSQDGDWVKDEEFEANKLFKGKTVITLYLEGIDPGHDMIEVEFNPDGQSPWMPDEVRVTVVKIDADVDSDNTKGNEEPERDEYEDRIEDAHKEEGGSSQTETESFPGKILVKNDSDHDSDGIPDFADGFSAFSGSEYKKIENTDGKAGFTPLVIELPSPLDPEKLRLKITYVQSDPGSVSRSGSEEEGYTYTAASGKLRIWTKDETEERNKKPVKQGGDFVEQGEYEGEDLQNLGRGTKVTLYIEGISAAEAEQIKVEVDPDGKDKPASWVCLDAVRVSIISVDLDIDSDNTNGTDDPDRNDKEDGLEDVDPQQNPKVTSKIVSRNDQDADNDGIPDFADGFDAFGDSTDDDRITAQGDDKPSFYPVILEIPDSLDLDKLRLKLDYTASDPANVQRSGTAGSGYTYTPAAGKIRLWTRNADEARDKDPVKDSGDFVKPGEYSGDDLGNLGFSESQRIVTLWLEGIQTGQDRITVEVDPDGTDGPLGFMVNDAVRVTVIRMEFVIPGEGYNNGENPNADPVATSFVGVSDPRPTITLDPISPPAVSSGTTSVSISLSGKVHDPIADNVPQGGGADIASVKVTVDGTEKASATVNRTRDANEGFWKQHAYEGSFSTTVQVDVAEGTHVIRVETSENAAGNTGFAEVAITFAKQEIPGFNPRRPPRNPNRPPKTEYKLNLRIRKDPTRFTADKVQYWLERSREFRATLSEDSRIEFVKEWQADNASDIAVWVDDKGTPDTADDEPFIYTTDTKKHRVMKFDKDGNQIATWGKRGIKDGQFKNPKGIAVDNSGNVYVADTGNHRIQKFDRDGNFLLKFGKVNRRGRPRAGSGNNEFRRPADVAIAANGSIYVVEQGNHRVQKLDSAGAFIAKWGTQGNGDGQFESPQSIAITQDGKVVVADTGNNRIQRFTADGAFIAKRGTQGSGPGEFNAPAGIAADAQGRTYVADTGNNRLQRFDATGNLDLIYGNRGADPGEFKRLLGVVAIAGDRLYTAEKAGNRVQEFKVKEQGGEASLRFTGLIPDPDMPNVKARVFITHLNGQPVTGGFILNPNNPDSVTAEISYIMPDDSIMNFGTLTFGETAVDSRLFRAVFEVIVEEPEPVPPGEPPAPPVIVQLTSSVKEFEQEIDPLAILYAVRIKGLPDTEGFKAVFSGKEFELIEKNGFHYLKSWEDSVAVLVNSQDETAEDKFKGIFYIDSLNAVDKDADDGVEVTLKKDDNEIATIKADVPRVEYYVKHADGTTEVTSKVPFSDPIPTLTLNPVYVTVSPAGQVSFTLSGEVTDPIADVTKDGEADVESVEVYAQDIESPIASKNLTKTTGQKTFWRPYPFRGTFTLSGSYSLAGKESGWHGFLVATSKNKFDNCDWKGFAVNAVKDENGNWSLADTVQDTESQQPDGEVTAFAIRAIGPDGYHDQHKGWYDGRNFDLKEDGGHHYFFEEGDDKPFIGIVRPPEDAILAGGEVDRTLAVAKLKGSPFHALRRLFKGKYVKMNVVVTSTKSKDWQSKTFGFSGKVLGFFGSRYQVKAKSVEEMVNNVKNIVGKADRTGKNGNCIKNLSVYSHGYVGLISMKDFDLDTIHSASPRFSVKARNKLAELKPLMYKSGTKLGQLNLEACSVGLAHVGRSFVLNLADLIDCKVFAISGEHLGVKRFGKQVVVKPGDTGTPWDSQLVHAGAFPDKAPKGYYYLYRGDLVDSDFVQEVYLANKALINQQVQDYINAGGIKPNEYRESLIGDCFGKDPHSKEYREYLRKVRDYSDVPENRKCAVSKAWRSGLLDRYTIDNP